MKAYICAECGWEHEIPPVKDRVDAVRRHQVGHLLERCGGTGAVRDILDALTLDTFDADGSIAHPPLAKV